MKPLQNGVRAATQRNCLAHLLLKLWDVSTGQNNFWAGPNNGIFQLTDYKVNRKAEILIVL